MFKQTKYTVKNRGEPNSTRIKQRQNAQNEQN